MSNGSYEIVVEDGDSYNIVVETSQVGPRGPQGIAGPNTVTEETSTPLHGVLVADGERIREALPGEVVNSEAMQSALSPIESAIGDLESGKANTIHSHDAATMAANGFMSSGDKSKLDGIAAGATANSADTILLDRANHTGTQAISTVTNLQASLDGKSPTNHTHASATTSTAGFMSASDKEKLNALVPLFVPVITEHPASQTFGIGDTVSLEYEATSPVSGGVTSQWQDSSDGATFGNISGAIAKSYSFVANSSYRNRQYRAIASNVMGSATTNAAALTLENQFLNNYSIAAAAFSLLLLDKNYMGPVVRVRRSSDSAERDFYDYEIGSSLTAWVGAGNGYVRSWYDQAGTNNATQATASLQPLIVESGVLVRDVNNMPGVRFMDGQGGTVGMHLELAPWHTASTAHVAVMSIYSMASTGNYPYVLGPSPASAGILVTHNTTTGAMRSGAYRSTLAIGNGPVVSLGQTYLRYDYTDRSNYRMYIDDANSASVSLTEDNTDLVVPTKYYIGNVDAGLSRCDQIINAMIFTCTDTTSVQEAARASLCDLYGIGV